MNAKQAIGFAVSCVGLTLVSTASAQTPYGEVEPNSTKLEATIVHCIHSTDTLVGTTTGTSTTPGSTLLDTADTFRVTTCALPLGIYRHRTFITSETPGHTAFLCGRNQVAGVIGPMEVAVQTSSAATIPTRFNEWYGFGRSEEVYYRIQGVPTTTSPYSVVLSSDIVTPVDFPVYVTEGTVTITTVGRSHMSNTDLWVYDSAFLPLFTFGNDDAPGTTSSALTRVFAAGTYYLAITDGNLANDQPSPIDDANRDGNVFDFPDMLATSSPATGVDLSFSITDVVRESSMSLVKNMPFEVKWVRFVVVPHTYSMHPFCAGDGHAGSEPCPCGNNGAANGHGCAGLPNQSGAYLDATGVPSVIGDTILLRCQDLPPGSTALFFQGSSLVNGGLGAVFSDGLLCAGGTQTRMAVRQVDPLGDALFGFGQPGDPAIHVAGGVPAAGGPLVYQVWYRNYQGPCGNRSNTSNGWVINWGH